MPTKQASTTASHGGPRPGSGRPRTTVTLRINEHVTASSGTPGGADWQSMVYKITAITTGKGGEQVFCLTPASPYTGAPLVMMAAPKEP